MDFRNTIRRHLVALVLLTAALALGAGCDSKSNAKEGPAAKAIQAAGAGPQAAKTVSALPVKAASFTSVLQVSATALPVHESYLASEVAGTIQQILVKKGEKARKGQVLLRFDQTNYLAGVQQGEAAVQAAKAGTDLAKLEFDRIEKLRASDATAAANVDRMRAQLDAAAAQKNIAQANLDRAQKALRDSELKAPYDGVIVEVLHEVGEFAAAMPPTPLMKIVDASSLEVQAFVPEDAAGELKAGQKAQVEVESAGVKTEGEIFFVSDRVQPVTQTFEVRVKVENKDYRIKAGALARVAFIRKSLEQAILVPVRAVQRDEKGVPAVFVAKEGKARRVAIKVGETQGALTLVTEGLAAGEFLITSGLSDLKDGEAVEIKAER